MITIKTLCLVGAAVSFFFGAINIPGTRINFTDLGLCFLVIGLFLA